MEEFTLETELWLPRPLEEVFRFFAEARNLEALTPPWVGFEIPTPAPIAMARGTIIDYRIRLYGLARRDRRVAAAPSVCGSAAPRPWIEK